MILPWLIVLFVIHVISGSVAIDYNENPYKDSRVLSSPEECARSCEKGGPSKTCYYRWTVEFFSTLANACTLCTNSSASPMGSGCQCITTDGYEMSGIMTVNRMYPGPSIVVCKGDYLVIDVTNHLAGNGITIHWHGIPQRDQQYYDGVPYVTQCPIGDGTTFRYQWLAENSGTFFWHAHTGMHMGDGLVGSLVIRQPKDIGKTNVNRHDRLWDYDNVPDNLIFLTDWSHRSTQEHYPGTLVRSPGQLPDNLLINGLGQWTDPVSGNSTTTPLAVFTVKRGYRYRFRIVNSFSSVCPVIFTIQRHNLTVIATDGLPVEPVNVTSIVSSSAERYDFVVYTDKPRTTNFWIQVRAFGNCASSKLHQLAVFRYEGGGGDGDGDDNDLELDKPTYEDPLDAGTVLNPLNSRCDGNADAGSDSSNDENVCVSELNSVLPVPKEIFQSKPNITLYMPIGFYTYPTAEIFKPGTYKKFTVVGGRQVSPLFDNVSNTFPSSPLLTQRRDTPDSKLCSWPVDRSSSSSSSSDNTGDSSPRECLNVLKVSLNSVVEVILVDEAQITGLSHPFHLHGYSFYIMSEGFGSEYDIKSISVAKVKDLDSRGMIERRSSKPPAKDTFAVPNNGFTVIRFIADNPGYWLFHCHFLFHLVGGMSAILEVGEPQDLPSIPRGFPKCGNFIPPILLDVVD